MGIPFQKQETSEGSKLMDDQRKFIGSRQHWNWHQNLGSDNSEHFIEKTWRENSFGLRNVSIECARTTKIENIFKVHWEPIYGDGFSREQQ